MLSLRSISNITEREAAAGGSLTIQIGRAISIPRTISTRPRKLARAIIRFRDKPSRCCRQVINTKAANSGSTNSTPAGNSKTTVAIMLSFGGFGYTCRQLRSLLGKLLEILLNSPAVGRRQASGIDVGDVRFVLLISQLLGSLHREMLELIH